MLACPLTRAQMTRAAASRPCRAMPGGKLIVVSGAAAINQLQRRLIKIILLVQVVLGAQWPLWAAALWRSSACMVIRSKMPTLRLSSSGSAVSSLLTSDQTFWASGEATGSIFPFTGTILAVIWL